MDKPPQSEPTSTADWLETVRDRFLRVTNLDLHYLTSGEMRNLLELLPAALVYLHTHFIMAKVYETEQDGQTFVDD